ncbi:hypothetical protein N7495_000043 [Penicillium taxi]|uniref:uncharacterized protein n=1 Tax=Penicillium taxi TaxID=168475 RepID=UPI00254524B8|nr:uncharacterized protein N7495_000043 [Penicillium taxi]KAJ5907361.1 hypothetical protein N7495_000043 [Penicillium taxi]
MSLAEVREELNEFKQQLDSIKQSLKVTPDNTELQTLKTEIEEIISETKISIAALEASQAPKYKSPADQIEKEQVPAQEKPKHHYDNLTYHVNEVVLARFEDDHCFHPARIVSVMGPPTNRMYMVVFTNFSGSQQVSSKDIAKNNNHAVKRKADSGPSAVVSAAPVLSQTQKAPAIDDRHKKRKIKNNAQLEAGKAKWQDFNAKSKGKGKAKKDSMFRTGDGINARVGFTGSGQEMRKDQIRTRHVYKEDHHESD